MPPAALDAQLRTIMPDELLDLTQSLRTTTLFITHSLGTRAWPCSGRTSAR
ncbi:hypothetical protein ACUXZZ_15030 [Streptomyces graminifolii]|uniref:hypothetical protein n=1 Tax=Streptomyces graminifolii TaxID=1266771 RepID=UPI0040591E5A